MNDQMRTGWSGAEWEATTVDPFVGGPWAGEVNRRSRDYMRWVQRSLNQILGLRLAEDGLMGLQTRQAIRTFQQRYGLTVDGVVGSQTERAIRTAGAGQLQPAPGKVRGVALPKSETTAVGTTVYATIDLAINNDQGQRITQPLTGIFLPAGYRPQTRLDLILYLHGFKTRAGLTINEYWDGQRFPHFALREGLRDSRRSAVLVAPTLGPKSQAGRLIRPGGLDAFVTQVLAVLRAHPLYSSAGIIPQLGYLILACHSGGGYPMRRLALVSDATARAIRECWGFDSTYNRGDDTLWAQWAKKDPKTRLYIYYIPKSRTETRSLRLQHKQLPNVTVSPSRPRGGHNWVPITHWRERIEGAPFLSSV